MATIFRGPLYSLRASRSVSRVPQTSQTDVWQNVGLTLRAPAAALPFNQDEWRIPRRIYHRFPLDNRTEVDPSEFWLLKDTFFGGAGQPPSPHDWPNPQPKPFALENRTQVDPSEFWLLAPVVPGPLGVLFHQTDWPNPQPKRFALENRTQTDPSEFWLFPPQAQAPFSQITWPNPTRKTPLAVSSLTSTFYYVIDDNNPPATSDFPNPTRAVPSRHLYTFVSSLLGTTLSAPPAPKPFSQTQWPNPNRPGYPIEDRTIVDPSEFWLLKDAFFGGPGQPPSPTPAASYCPRPYPIDARTWTQSHLLDTLAPTVKPFTQTEWPVPRGPRAVISLRTIAEFTRLLGKDRIFGGVGQPITIWPQPNPIGYRYPADLRTSALSLASFYQNLASLGTVHCAEVVSLNPRRTVLWLSAGIGDAIFDPAVFDPELFDALGFVPRLTVKRDPEC